MPIGLDYYLCPTCELRFNCLFKDVEVIAGIILKPKPSINLPNKPKVGMLEKCKCITKWELFGPSPLLLSNGKVRFEPQFQPSFIEYIKKTFTKRKTK